MRQTETPAQRARELHELALRHTAAVGRALAASAVLLDAKTLDAMGTEIAALRASPDGRPGSTQRQAFLDDHDKAHRRLFRASTELQREFSGDEAAFLAFLRIELASA